MNRTPRTVLTALFIPAAAVAFMMMGASRGRLTAAPLPAPALSTAPIGAALDTAVFAGGCFWGIEAVFEHMNGVRSAESGYAGGMTKMPSYEAVSDGDTGHAEVVQVVYDPSVVSYAKLLHVFFSVAHDPTQLNRQGPDRGTQYRSAIFYRTDSQKKDTDAYIAQLTAAKTFPRPIVTEVAKLRTFHRAEEYHQDYMVKHPNQPYIVINDAPKVEALRKQFPDLYRDGAR